MQICSVKKLILCGISFIVFSTAIFSQSIEMPTIEMPKMPQITTDFNSDFNTEFKPGFPNGFYKPTVPTAPGKPDATTKTNGTESVSNQTLSTANTTDDLLSAFLNGNSNLSASDISSLYDSGLFGTLSGLYGTSTASVPANSSDVLLERILKSLEELKDEQKNATPAQKDSLEKQQLDSETFKSREPTILRFKINGYNIADSLTTVFFSEPEPDGSFLLTGDRRYFTNQKPRTETFYILFKAVRNLGASTTYTVEPSIVQDSKNDNSFVYKFCHLKNLTAEKTGNLVVLKESGDLNVDLLLDIDK